MVKKQRQPNLFLEICQVILGNKLTLLLLICVFFSALAVVQVTHQTRQQTILQDKLLQERDELDLQWRYLVVEEEFYSQHAKVEEIAVSKLEMRRPTSKDEQVIQLP